jgi:hypothetical protein
MGGMQHSNKRRQLWRRQIIGPSGRCLSRSRATWTAPLTYGPGCASNDDQTRAMLSAELRLLETGLKSLLTAVTTDLPAPKSARALHAAETRWSRGSD